MGGEIAEMMLDGTLDSETGEYIGDINEEIYGETSPGFPITYEGKDNEPFDSELAQDFFSKKPSKAKLKVNCPYCKKRVKEIGLNNHIGDAHPDIETNLKIIYTGDE